jgi:hypothetical protein
MDTLASRAATVEDLGVVEGETDLAFAVDVGFDFVPGADLS